MKNTLLLGAEGAH